MVRFETEPGAQVGFAQFRFPWYRCYVLLGRLGYYLLLRFYLPQGMRTLARELEVAFGFFGGDSREALFDQMKSVIARNDRLRGGGLVQSGEFLRFAAHEASGLGPGESLIGRFVRASPTSPFR